MECRVVGAWDLVVLRLRGRGRGDDWGGWVDVEGDI